MSETPYKFSCPGYPTQARECGLEHTNIDDLSEEPIEAGTLIDLHFEYLYLEIRQSQNETYTPFDIHDYHLSLSICEKT